MAEFEISIGSRVCSAQKIRRIRQMESLFHATCESRELLTSCDRRSLDRLCIANLEIPLGVQNRKVGLI